MSELLQPGSFMFKPAVLAETPDISHAVRQLRWFSKSFKRHLATLQHMQFVVQDRRLADGFVGWLHRFDEQKWKARGRERDFVGFASGLMLRSLIANEPIRAVFPPDNENADHPARFWPEGYAYVTYCLNVRAAVLVQEFGERLELDQSVQDIEAWWSFKENARENASSAIPFLDHFTGKPANWASPDLFM